MHKPLSIAPAIMALLFWATVPVQGQSALDGFDPNANGTVRVVVVQPDGKILIGGDFTTVLGVARNRIARLNPDGTLDTAFDPNANSAVLAIAVQADGKILVSGVFTSIGGQTRNRIARLDAATGLADSFNPNANVDVYAIAAQADGKILAGGPFTSVGGQTRNFIARLDPTTGLADSFNPNANLPVNSIAVQADGKILAGGIFTTIGGQSRNRIARLDATSGLADSFNPDATDPVNSIVVQTDGKVLAGGVFNTIGGQTRGRIARLDGSTGLADSFNPNASDTVNSIVVQADGKILAGGVFTSIGGQTRNRIVRLDATTGLADSFNPNASSSVFSIAVQADGKILAGGGFMTIGGQTRNNIARLETDGRLDQTLDLGASGFSVLATAMQTDGKILIGGQFSSVLGVPRNNIARLNTDGTLDTAFNPNANSLVYSIAVQADGKILAGGDFTTIGGQTRNNIARLDATTGAADSFNPNANTVVYAIAVQADGKILAGGGFTTIGGQTRNRIARLDATTGAADSFNPDADSFIISIAVQVDGKVLAGGSFTSIGGQPRNFIARLDATTGLAESFNPNANNWVYVIAVQADAKILAGGAFTSIGGQPRNFIARLDATTGLAESFNPNANANFVFSIAVQADGKILAGGGFTSMGGQPRNRIVRLDATTGLADSFNPNANANFVFSIAVQADGKVLAGGDFTSIGGQPRNFFARLSNDTAALQDLAVTQTTITWTRGGASAQFARVTFESSTDNVNYALLGSGTAAGSNWTLTGLNLPTGQNIYVRARGYYRSGYGNGSANIIESVRNAFIAGPAPTPTPTPIATPANVCGRLSTRARVNTGQQVLISAFAVTGSGTKKVLLRALGPSLAGVAGRLADPTLELRDENGALVSSNNNWRDTQQAQIEATGQAPSNDLESALVTTIPTGNYVAIVQGLSGTTGVGKVDIIDVDPSDSSQLRRISSRAFAGTEGNRIVGEFTINGPQAQSLIIRGLGPSLSATGVSGVLPNPTLELRDGNGALLIANNDWQDDPSQAAAITAAGLAPSNNLESALIATLPPGSYTAHLAGLNCTTGMAAVEVYSGGLFSNAVEIPVSSGPLQGCGPTLPVITSPLNATGVVDRQFIYQFTATGATLLGVSNLPAGLTFNTTLAAITGAPTSAGMFQVGLSASNGAGTTNATLTIDVQPPPASGPVIISGNAATGRPGLLFRFQVTTSGGTSAARVSASGLPAGLSIDPASGLISGTPTAEGSFAVTLTVTDGAFTTSSILQITLTTDLAVPVIVSPSSASLVPGQFFSYTINAPSTADPSSDPTTFTLIGTLPAGLTFNAVTGTISGTYTGPLGPDLAGGAILGSIQLFATNSHGTSTFQLLFRAPPSGVVNIATRLLMGTGDNVLIGGFIITGNAPKVVLIRAIGPTLTNFGVPNALEDPTLKLQDSASHVVVNDNWRDTQEQFIIDTGLPPVDNRESAIVIALDRGSYTAIVEGKNGATGIALVEVYDLGTASLDTSGNVRLGDISTRGLVGTGDNRIIGGFIVQRAATRVVVRALGPSLLAFGISDALLDPTLELRNASGDVLMSNDEWEQGQPVEIQEAGLAPTHPHESALITTLPPGQYTAVVGGQGNTTGVGLVEVYALE
jgi:uncharacterized delta-60 repeat protein